MADEYGLGAAALAGLHLFEAAQRGSGRTSRLIERVRDGDQIVCADSAECLRLVRLLKDAKKDVRVFVVDDGRHPMSRVRTAPHGRTFFDHGWILQHFAAALRHAERDLEHFQREASKTWPEPPGPASYDSQAAMVMTEIARRR